MPCSLVKVNENTIVIHWFNCRHDKSIVSFLALFVFISIYSISIRIRRFNPVHQIAVLRLRLRFYRVTSVVCCKASSGLATGL